MPSHLNLHGKELLVVNACSRSGHFFVIHNVCSWTGKADYREYMFWNMENIYPRKVGHELRKIKPQDMKESVRILQTRDLLNWIASTVQRRNEKRGSNFKHRWDPVKAVGVWMAIAQEFYDETVWISNFVRVSYEQFFQSEEYRRGICDQVGGTYNEENLNRVSQDGRGSSFDGLEYEDKAQEMKVLYRYRQVPMESFMFLRDYPKVVDLYLKYCHPNDEQKDIVGKIMG